MKIIASLKIVPDDQDIQVAADGSLDFSKAKPVVSAYDLNAIEAAAQLAAADEASSAIGITAGPASINDSKTKKNVLSRGLDELFMTADDACEGLDAFQTAGVLVELVGKVGDWDVVICGDGSADNYAQQVDVQLASKLNVPFVNGVSRIEAGDGVLVCTRMLEDVTEVVEVSLPAVVSVVPDVAQPRIPGMKDILAAGKKPSDVSAAAELAPAAVEIVECKAPERVARKCEILDASEDGAVEKFAAAIKAAL